MGFYICRCKCYIYYVQFHFICSLSNVINYNFFYFINRIYSYKVYLYILDMLQMSKIINILFIYNIIYYSLFIIFVINISANIFVKLSIYLRLINKTLSLTISKNMLTESQHLLTCIFHRM